MYYIVGDTGNPQQNLFTKKIKIVKSIIFNTKNIFLNGYLKKY